MKKYFARFVMSFVLAVGFVQSVELSSAYGQNACRSLYALSSFSRAQVAGFAIYHDIPALETTARVPVLLANQKTVSTLDPLFENSLGVQVALQPGWKNDHGLLRLGRNVIDMDSPGARGFGEIHETGLAWKVVSEYVARKNSSSSKVVEVLYSLSKDEMDIANLYQRVRRAAIYRVPFAFGGHQGRKDLPNFVPNGGENCFSFCRGSSIFSQIQFMQGEVQRLTQKNFENLKNDPRIVQFLNESKSAILAADVTSAKTLSQSLVFEVPAAKAVIDMLAPNQSKQEQQSLLSWIIALDSTQKYAALLRTLEVGSGTGWEGSSNARATAIVIYDVAATAEQFKDSGYRLPGIFNTWDHKNMLPLREVSPEDIVTQIKQEKVGFFGRLRNWFRQ